MIHHDTGCRIQDKKLERRPQSYKDLEVYSPAKQLAVKIHKMTIEGLPKFEMYEEGSQIRRSSKSVVANIGEGFGRRQYKNEFIRFLNYAAASCDETKVHLEILDETGSLNKNNFDILLKCYEELGAKLFKFRETVIKSHRT